MTTSSGHAWLRRLSDYHSGGVSDAERLAVEAHLATCEQCQEALAMYRSLYMLLRSPLRLGAPGARFDFDEPTTIIVGGTADSQPEWRLGGPAPRDPRRRVIAGVAAALAAAVVIAGFVAVFASRQHSPTASGTPPVQASVTPQPSTTAQPTITPQPTGTTSPQPSAFVCANPAGSSMTYAYMRGDGNIYVVTGCSAPRQIASTGPATTVFPVAWSPSNRYLAVSLQNYPDPSKIGIIDMQTGAVSSTRYTADFGRMPSAGTTERIFFGWLDDNTFLGAIAPLVNGSNGLEEPGTSTLVRVDLRSGTETTVGTIPGWVVFGPALNTGVRITANGRYLFYAAYTGSTANLHRFDLSTGTDATLVSLGLYGNGGCQGTTVCGWTAPWDVSSDGSHILYHNPGAASTPSDINNPKDTLVLYANPDGSGASTPFGAQLAASVVTPVFSPSGNLAVTADSTYNGTNPFAGNPQMKLVTFGNPATLVAGSFGAWRGDSQALVVFGSQATPVLYDLVTGTIMPLEANSNFFLWGN
jgi:Putative zinc-finger